MPFINFATGLVLQNNGTNVNAGVLDFSGTSLVVSDGVATYTPATLTMTDGESTTIDNVTTLTANSLSLAGTEVAPVLVQSQLVNNGGTLQLPNAVTPGNYVVWFGLYAATDPAPPSPFTKLEDGGFNEGQGFLCGGVATQSASPEIPLGANGFGGIYEFSGVTGVTHGTPNISAFSYNFSDIAVKSIVLSLWCSAFNGIANPTALSPSGTVEDSVYFGGNVNSGGLLLRTGAVNGSVTIGFTNGEGGSTTVYYLRYIILTGGFSPGNASITG